MGIAQVFQWVVPRAWELPLTPDVTQVPFGEPEFTNKTRLTQIFDDFSGCDICHSDTMTNNLSLFKTRERLCGKISCHSTIVGMELSDKPFGDIAARLKWHRDLEGLTQNAYAKKIGVKRATLNNWESGDYRLSLDGAIALRQTYGLSLDFMYEGIDDALPMTLRKAWQSRP